jgi:translation initiation factor eIF-2B subunit beta
LTLGHSQTVEAFLKAAARKRKITVVVAETAPTFSGRSLALALSAASIPTLLVPDSAIYSLMSRISKVILGTHIVHADGSLVAISGTLPMAKVARAHNVPVIVVTGMFKVSNEFAYYGETGNLLEEMDNASPAEALGLHDDQDAHNEGLDLEVIMEKCEVVTPYWDRIPQELVSLFITNIGAHPSSMIFRLLKELFD